MKRISRKYILIILAFLTTLLCMVGSSTWIILSQKTETPTKIEKLDLDVSIDSLSKTLFYGDTVESSDVGLTNAVAKIKDTDTTVKGDFSITEINIDPTVTGTSATIKSENNTATIQFTPKNTALYNTPDPITLTSIPVQAVAYCGNTYYPTLDNAISKANTTADEKQTTQEVYVIPDLGRAINVTETLTLKKYVELYIPFENKTCDIGSSRIEELALNSMNYYADGDSDKVKTNRKTLINLSNGADIIINSGAELRLGGEFGTKSIAGKYCEINLDKGSSIDCSGNLYIYGYIKENSSSAQNGNQSLYQNYYNNKHEKYTETVNGEKVEQERLIKINSGGSIETGIAIYDMQAASNLLALNNVKVFPLNIFDFPNLQTYIEIDTGATLKSKTHILATSSQGNIALTENICIINSDINSASIFHLSNGKVGIEYCPVDTLYTSATGTTRIYLNGDVQQGHIELTISNQSIDTRDSLMPISYKFNIYINDSATFTNTYKIKFLPGSLLKINTKGTLNVSNQMIFHKKETASLLVSYPTSNNDAILINNGTLQVSSEGAIGAFIQTEKTDNSAVLDFSQCADSSAFTVSCNESKNAVQVTRTSEGYFNDDSTAGKSLYQFKAGSIVNSSSKGTKCWDGDKYAIRTLSINIAQTSYTYNIYSYRIYVKGENDTTSTEITSGDTTSAGSHDIPDGQYVQIVATRHNGAKFTSGAYNGETLNNSNWYRVTSDMALTITPNEGIKISLYTDTDSGNGATSYTISESSTKNGTFVEIASQTGVGSQNQTANHLVAYIVKDWYIKVSYTNGLGSTTVDSSGAKITPEGGSATRLYYDTATQVFTNSTIYCPRKSGCVAAGTLITLADGTQKKVEDLTYSDQVLVFNHYTGKMETGYIAMLDHLNVEPVLTTVTNLKFSNGELLRIVWNHGVFDITLNEYVFINENNCQDFVGHQFYSASYVNGEFVSQIVTLECAFVTDETVKIYNPTTLTHMNYFASTILNVTAAPEVVSGHVNYFELDENMKYDEEKMQADIEQYGLYTYEDFKDLLTEEQFNALPFKYLKVSVGKGLITWDGIVAIIEYLLENSLM